MLTVPDQFTGNQYFHAPLSPAEPGPKRRGRPELLTDDELLNRRENLLLALEEHWCEFAWKLPSVKTLPALREALDPLKETEVFDLFASSETQKSNRTELHNLRKKQKGIEAGLYGAAQNVRIAQESLQRATDALKDVGADPKLQQLCGQRQRKLDEITAEQEKLRQEHQTIGGKLLRQERYIAQSEFLDFLLSKRYSLTPLHIANALAGVPQLTWRVSATRRQKHGPSRLPGFYYQMFLHVRKALEKPPKTADQAVEQAKNYLLKLRPEKHSAAGYLCKNFYYVRTAIESAYKARPTRKALPYRAFSEFRRREADKNRLDQVMEEEERLTQQSNRGQKRLR